jgi:hypothetical protein
MQAIYLIIFCAVLAMTGLAIGDRLDQQERVALTAPTERQQALICWHEFQSGRRSTTADCPAL